MTDELRQRGMKMAALHRSGNCKVAREMVREKGRERERERKEVGLRDMKEGARKKSEALRIKDLTKAKGEQTAEERREKIAAAMERRLGLNSQSGAG